MSHISEINAMVREVKGKRANRRLRHQELVPGIVYGGSKDPACIMLSHSHIARAAQDEGFYVAILNLHVEEKVEKVVVKAIQRHPYKPKITHIDFMRINDNETLTMKVPLHFINAETALGVKIGGNIAFHLNEIDAQCLPSDLPEYLTVDVGQLGMEQYLHVSDIILPKGVSLTHNLLEEAATIAIASIHAPKLNKDTDQVTDSSTSDTNT